MVRRCAISQQTLKAANGASASDNVFGDDVSVRRMTAHFVKKNSGVAQKTRRVRITSRLGGSSWLCAFSALEAAGVRSSCRDLA